MPKKTVKPSFPRFEAPSKRLIHSIDVSPDGALLAVAQHSGSAKAPTLSLVDLKTGGVVRIIERVGGDAESVHRVTFAPQRDLLAYVLQAGGAFRLKLLDLQRGPSVSIAEDQQPLMAQGLCFDAGGQTLMVSGLEIRVIDVASHRVLRSFPVELADESAEPNVAAAMSPDGRTIAVGGAHDGRVTLYDASDGSVLKTLSAPFGGAGRLEFDRSGKHVAVMDSFGHGVFMWDVESGKRYLDEVFNEQSPPLCSMRFSRASSRFALGMVMPYVVLYDTDSGEELAEDKLHKGRVTDVCFSPDGSSLISAGDDHQIFVRPL